jgi:hypothetical protein
MPGQTRAWFVGAWFCLAFLLAVAALAFPRCIVVCDAVLVSVAEPDGWRDWPLADPGTTCGGVCPGGDVPREGWDSVEGPVPPELWLRHDPSRGVFVVGGAPRTDEAPRERFMSAFQREPGRRLAFTSNRAAACSLLLGLSLAVLLVGMGAARRRLRVAERLVESLRGAHLALASDPATYRRAPTVKALEAGAHDARSADGARLAVGALRTSLLAVAGLFALFLVSAGGVVLREWVRLMF